MFTDRRNTHPATVFAGFQLSESMRDGGKNVYLYYFSESVEVSQVRSKLERYGTNESLGNWDFVSQSIRTFCRIWIIKEKSALGAAHGDELQFLFPYYPFPFIPLGSKNANFSQVMVHLWVSFADTG